MQTGIEYWMTNIVLDTNVIISAVLSPAGNPAAVVSLISTTDKLQVFYSGAILDEYKRVLAYERLNIPKEKQNAVIGTLRRFGIPIEPTVSTTPMTDETDRVFYDTAKTSGAILITGNIRHYPAMSFIMTPTDFLGTL